MPRNPYLAALVGALLVVILAFLAGRSSAGHLVAGLEARAKTAIAEAGGTGVSAEFVSASGFPSRHVVLSGGERLGEAARDRVAKAVAAIPGAAGVRWSDGSGFAQSSAAVMRPLHCQEDVQALLRARTIRFEESSAEIQAASHSLIGEVAEALRPCLGSIIAITGHTDSSGPEPGNIALSQERAEAVQAALIRRGIPADGLRARGVGSAEPVTGLDPGDPANRRIDFSVIQTVSIQPTPVDTPGPR